MYIASGDSEERKAMTMNPIYRAWWRALMDLRPLVRFWAERFPKLAPWAVRLRWLLHVLVGNPVQTVTVVGAGWAWLTFEISYLWPLAVVAVVLGGVEVWHRVMFRAGGFGVGWREGWRLRRRWPSDWATVAAKTARVQAEVGTSKEPVASAVLRPIADHPKLSWWPHVEWPVVWWWVGPPPGRSLAALDELAVILAANISHAADVAVEYERENDSHGRLIVSFVEVLADPSTPSWVTDDPGPVGPRPGSAVLEVDDELGQAVAEFEQQTARLRLVDGEAS